MILDVLSMCIQVVINQCAASGAILPQRIDIDLGGSYQYSKVRDGLGKGIGGLDPFMNHKQKKPADEFSSSGFFVPSGYRILLPVLSFEFSSIV